MGQLWKARTPQTRKDLKQILEPVFSSLLFRVPSWGRSFLCLPHVCKCCVQVSYQAKRVNRRGTDIFWSHLCSVFGLISESPHLLPCSYPITKFFSFFFFFLVSLFQLYELGWSLLSSCAAHNFIIYSAFLKIPSQMSVTPDGEFLACHRFLIRLHSSFSKSFLFLQPACFMWQGQFSAVSWLDTPTLFMLITLLHPTHTKHITRKLRRLISSKYVSLTQEGFLFGLGFFSPPHVLCVDAAKFWRRVLISCLFCKAPWTRSGVPWVIGSDPSV